MLGIVIFPYSNTYAASWLDNNNYDTSWYTTNMGTYSLNTAEEMAGLAYLVNNENITFEGKYIEITSDIDLTENTWQTIKDIFEGTICGSHRIILNCFNGQLIENNNKFSDRILYSYPVLIDSSNLEKINVGYPYTVESLKAVIGANSTVFFNNEKLSDDTYLQELDITSDNILEVFSGRYIYIENAKGIKIPFYVESGDSIYNVKEKYSKKINISQDKIIIKYQEKELNDERTIADYNIQKYETINAYIEIDITTNVDEGKGTIVSSQDTAIEGEKVTITLEPEEEYELSKILVNGTDKTNEVQNYELKIECCDEDINIKVSYKLKEKEVEEKEETEKTGKIEEMEKTEEVEEIDETDIELKDNEVKENNPQTGDNIMSYVVTIVMSIFGLITTLIVRKKK